MLKWSSARGESLAAHLYTVNCMNEYIFFWNRLSSSNMKSEHGGVRINGEDPLAPSSCLSSAVCELTIANPFAALQPRSLTSGHSAMSRFGTTSHRVQSRVWQLNYILEECLHAQLAHDGQRSHCGDSVGGGFFEGVWYELSKHHPKHRAGSAPQPNSALSRFRWGSAMARRLR